MHTRRQYGSSSAIAIGRIIRKAESIGGCEGGVGGGVGVGGLEAAGVAGQADVGAGGGRVVEPTTAQEAACVVELVSVLVLNYGSVHKRDETFHVVLFVEREREREWDCFG